MVLGHGEEVLKVVLVAVTVAAVRLVDILDNLTQANHIHKAQALMVLGELQLNHNNQAILEVTVLVIRVVMHLIMLPMKLLVAAVLEAPVVIFVAKVKVD